VASVGVRLVKRHATNADRWCDDSIQFPRLIAEIMATQAIDFEALCDAMDLDVSEVNGLFDRANRAWERAKREVTPGSREGRAPLEEGEDPDAEMTFAGVSVTITRSAGQDDAPVVLVDTDPERIEDGDRGRRRRLASAPASTALRGGVPQRALAG